MFLASPRLVNISGLNRCILPYLNLPGAQEISEVLLRGDRVRISSPTVRAVPSMTHFNKMHRGSTSTVAAPGPESFRLFGQPTPGLRQQKASSVTDTSTCFPFAGSEVSNKSRKELPGPKAADNTSRFGDRFRTEHSYAVSMKGRDFSELPGSFPAGQTGPFSFNIETAGAHGLNDSGSPVGSPLYACLPEMGTEHEI